MSKLKSVKVIRSMRRTLTMQLLPDTTLVVKAPIFFPQFEINKFIEKNNDWIDKKLAKFQQRKKMIKTFQDGEEFLYLGKALKLKIGNYQSISPTENFLHFPNFLVFRVKKELELWYINQAKKVITELVTKYSAEMKTSFVSVTFSDTKSKWGSCTHDNRLQFCWRLIMAPEMVVRYVVVHELAHTIEKNHSRSFWNRVSAINPSYKQQIKWLKINGDSLM